jgi:hypothetical protein
MVRYSYLKITYGDQEEIDGSRPLNLISGASFPMNNADSGVVSLKLKGKTTGTLSLEMEMHTKILPAVDIRDVWKESKRLRATPFTLTTVNATEEEDLPSLFDFKNLREVFALNYFEGDLTTRFQENISKLHSILINNINIKS